MLLLEYAFEVDLVAYLKLNCRFTTILCKFKALLIVSRIYWDKIHFWFYASHDYAQISRKFAQFELTL